MTGDMRKLKSGADLVDFAAAASAPAGLAARSQNFLARWIDSHTISVASSHEIMVIPFDNVASVTGGGETIAIRARHLAILPAGSYAVDVHTGRALVITSDPDAAVAPPANAASYAVPDKRVTPVGRAWRRKGDTGKILIYDIENIAAPADNPRLKMFLSDTLSINWVGYSGPRDRKALSPHSHADFEQASIAIEGNFVHHLRVNWSKNADEWIEDEHVAAPSPSAIIIPPEIIHTSEGVGPERHLLIDVFAPPRRDFHARGWFLNAGDYLPPDET